MYSGVNDAMSQLRIKKTTIRSISELSSALRGKIVPLTYEPNSKKLIREGA
jgi:hypothetical protein